MNNQAKAIWNSSQGSSLMRAMLGQKKMSAEDEQVLQKLKEVDPPNLEEMNEKEPGENKAVTAG